MNPEHVQTSLRFVGDWPWWAGVAAACVLGLAALLLYRREMLAGRWWARLLLPGLRALAVFMIVLMLSGPVLHHRKVIGQLSRLLLFVDGSKSMGLTDTSMSTGRKILILQRLGLWRSDAVKMDLPQAGEALAEAQSLAGRAREMTGGQCGRIGASSRGISRRRSAWRAMRWRERDLRRTGWTRSCVR